MNRRSLTLCRRAMSMPNGDNLAVSSEDPAVLLALIRDDVPRLCAIAQEMAEPRAAAAPGEEPAQMVFAGMGISLYLDRHDRLCRAVLVSQMSRVLRGESDRDWG